MIMFKLKDLVLSFINFMLEFAKLVILTILLISTVAFSIFAFLIIFSWEYIIAGKWLLLFGRGVANARNYTLEKNRSRSYSLLS